MKEIIKQRPYTCEEKYYYKLYLFFVKNKYVPYNKFMQALKRMLNIQNIYPSRLYKKIEYMKTYISDELAKEMKLILDYMIAVKNNDKEIILDLYPEVKDIDLNNHISQKQEKPTERVYNYNHRTFKSKNETSNNVSEKLMEDLDSFISKNKYISEYSEDEKIEIQKLCQRVSNIINRIEPENYIKFTKLYNDLKPISSKELDQYLEVLEYFCKYLDENILKFIQLDTEEEIRNFYVSGEENFSDSCKANISMLRKCKMYRIRAHQEHYHKLKDLMYTFKENLNLEDLYSLDNNCRRNIKADMPCIYEFYEDIIKLAKMYNSISKSNILSYSKRERAKEEFVKQMILRNN